MKQFNKKIALIALLSFNMTPVQAEIKMNDITSPIISTAMGAAACYILVTHLIKEDALVAAKYPHAKAWYDAMGAKYPAAHLESKPFLQNIWGMPVSLMSWSSTFNQIYFPKNVLIRINSLYGMQLENQTLSQEDQLYLAEQEFILLHEAGHIEHNDITRTFICTAALGAVMGGFIDKQKCLDNDISLDLPKKLNVSIKLKDHKDNDVGLHLPINNGILLKKNIALKSIDGNDITTSHTFNLTHGFITAAISAVVMQLMLSRYHERNADAFAYTNGDDLALQGGLHFFESELIDPLFNIESKQPSRYIKTYSTVGEFAQSLASSIEAPFFYINKTVGTIINSTSVTRWLYDAARGLTHPGGPARAQAIRDEIARRAQAQSRKK